MTKRWTIPFVSQANKQCRIDIYDPDWTGSVTELSTTNANAPGVAATDPFFFEEDDDEDLLEVVRVKTGYINLIETVQDGLLDLLPTSLKSRYVEMFYDNTIMFRGYIQQQNFENDWISVPREVSLPVVSVMGIAESLEFEPEMGVTDKCIGYYMKKVLRMVDPDDSWVTRYRYVTFPENSRDGFAGDFAATIRPLVTTIDNPEFSKKYGGSKNPYKGISLYDFLEGICNAYGWILHDMPTRVLFTKFDNSNRDYAFYPVYYNSTADIETATDKTTERTEGVTNLDTYMQPSADDGTTTQIMPLRTITLKNPSDMTTSAKAEFNHMRCSNLFTATIDNEKSALAELENGNNNIKDIASDHLLTNTGITDWIFDQDGVAVLDFKNKKRIVVQKADQWQGSGNLFSLYFYDRPLRDPDNYIDGNLKMEVDCSWGTNLLGLDGHDDLRTGVAIQISLYCGITLLANKTMEFYNDDTHQQTVEFDNVTIPSSGTLWLSVKCTNVSEGFFAARLLSFDNIRLYYEQPVTIDYLVDNKDYMFVGDSGGIEEADVDMLMSCQFVNSHTINNSFVLSSIPIFTNYSYLRHPQNRLQLRMKAKPQQTFNELLMYTDKLQYWQSSWRWRLIALSFHPWDDEWTLTLHHSTTIDS